MLRGKELTTGFARIGGIVRDQEFIGIAKQVDMAAFKVAELKPGHTFEYIRQALVFVFDGIAQTVTGGIEIGKQAFNILLGRVTTGRGFDSRKDGRQIGIQAFVGIGIFSNVYEQLAGVNKVALGFDGVVFDVWRDHTIG